MPVKIRLSRHGKKGKPFYHIVIADSRSPRDGRFIERIGSYNPNTNPAHIVLNFDRALLWLQKGATPTETCRNIMSAKGVLLKNHLLKGVTKGALTQEQAEAKFKAWIEEREAKVRELREKEIEQVNTHKRKRISAESKVREKRATLVAKKRSVLVEEVKEAEATTETTETPQE
jgi:small subunit ribosomal protein S16